MRLDKYEFYTMTPFEFDAACTGFIRSRKHQIEVTRLSTYLIHKSMVNSKISLQDFWKIQGEEEEKPKYDYSYLQDKDKFNEIMKLHGIDKLVKK